jgi:hypothetical protein
LAGEQPEKPSASPVKLLWPEEPAYFPWVPPVSLSSPELQVDPEDLSPVNRRSPELPAFSPATQKERAGKVNT